MFPTISIFANSGSFQKQLLFVDENYNSPNITNVQFHENDQHKKTPVF